jgi:hypothetical protein
MPKNWHGARQMASKPRGNDVAKRGTAFALNAGRAVNLLVSGPNRDKTIARMFGVSVRMAKYLRTGRCWTVERLQTASALLGREFDDLLVPLRCAVEPILPPPTEEIHRRLDALERELADFRSHLRGTDGP